MKKQLLFFVMILLPIVACADAVEINGIYYNLISKRKVAEVTSNPNIYTGSVVIPETVDYDNVTYSVTSIDIWAFYGCSGLTSVTIPNGVTSIGDVAFGLCSSLTSITIPNSVTNIGASAFESCTGLTSITIPNSVTQILEYAFYGCSGLTSITIGSGIEYLGRYTFAQCPKLTDVYCYAETVPSTYSDVFKNSYIENATLHVPATSVDLFKAAEQWKNFQSIVAITDDIAIGSAGMATYCSTHALDFSGTDDIKAYIVSAFKPSTGEVTMTRITDVPANTGIIVKGDADTYSIPWGAGETIVSNMLVGVTANTVLNKVDGDYTNYILAKKNGNLGFYAVADGTTLGAGKAYLPLPTASLPSGSGARGLQFIFDDEQITDITEIQRKNDATSEIYDLQGRKVIKPTKGLYIIDGKKVTIK